MKYISLQTLECLSLPHVQTLNKSFENDFSTYLTQATSSFSSVKRNVTVPID